MLVHAIDIMASGSNYHFVRTFKVCYEREGELSHADDGAIFKGNRGRWERRRVWFEKPFVADEVKLSPVSWDGSINMRWEVYVTEPTEDDLNPPADDYVPPVDDDEPEEDAEYESPDEHTDDTSEGTVSEDGSETETEDDNDEAKVVDDTVWETVDETDLSDQYTDSADIEFKDATHKFKGKLYFNDKTE